MGVVQEDLREPVLTAGELSCKVEEEGVAHGSWFALNSIKTLLRDKYVVLDPVSDKITPTALGQGLSDLWGTEGGILWRDEREWMHATCDLVYTGVAEGRVRQQLMAHLRALDGHLAGRVAQMSSAFARVG